MKTWSNLEALVPGGIGIGCREVGPTLVGGLFCCCCCCCCCWMGAKLMAAPIERLLLGWSPRRVTIFARGDDKVSSAEGKLSYASKCFNCQGKVVDGEKRGRLQMRGLEMAMRALTCDCLWHGYQHLAGVRPFIGSSVAVNQPTSVLDVCQTQKPLHYYCLHQSQALPPDVFGGGPANHFPNHAIACASAFFPRSASSILSSSARTAKPWNAFSYITNSCSTP